MPRIARVVVPDLPYHITQRGNYRQKVFKDDTDRLKYLTWISEYSRKYHTVIYAYCLMDNHVHFIAVPGEKDSLAKIFSITHMRYSQYFNKKMKASGHLWQGRFYSCVLEEPYLMAAVRYVERNPVRARMIRKPWNYRWSTAAVHAGQGEAVIPLGDITKFMDVSMDSWKQYLDDPEDEKEINEIRKHTLLGRPLGTVEFLVDLGKRVGRRLSALPRGRPRKKDNK